jgi:hypothetical protein
LNPSRTRVRPVWPPCARRGLAYACCRCGPSDVADRKDVADRADITDREDVVDRPDVADRADVADREDVADLACAWHMCVRT